MNLAGTSTDAELTRRCREAGLEVNPELEIEVSLGDFNKYYFADQRRGDYPNQGRGGAGAGT